MYVSFYIPEQAVSDLWRRLVPYWRSFTRHHNYPAQLRKFFWGCLCGFRHVNHLAGA